ncbi:uncharacterized protein LOC115214538 [Argonauta hians]
MIDSLIQLCEVFSSLLLLLWPYSLTTATSTPPPTPPPSTPSLPTPPTPPLPPLLLPPPPPPPHLTRFYNFDDFLQNIDLANRLLRIKMVGIISRTTDDEDLLQEFGSGNGAPASSKRSAYYNSADPSNVCCSLGRIAGERGFHCHSDVYKARYDRQNQQRIQRMRKHFTDSTNVRSSPEKFVRKNFRVRNNNRLLRPRKVFQLYKIYSEQGDGGDEDVGSSTNYNGNDFEKEKKVWEDKNTIKSLLINFHSCISRRPQDFHRCCYTASQRKQQMYRFHRHKHLKHNFNSMNDHVINYFY